MQVKVILNQTVPKVGKQNTVVTVAPGYARNYLFPRGLAIYADKTQIAALEKRNARLDEKLAGQKSEAESLKVKLDGQTIKIEGKVGATAGKLFGAITSQDVIDTIKKELGVALDKKQVALIEPIKKLGKHQVQIDLHRAVDAFVTVHVFDPNAPEDVEEPVVEEAVVTEEPVADEE
jgi:large subunit ribosomal protein L9